MSDRLPHVREPSSGEPDICIYCREDADGRIAEILRSAASVGGLSYLLVYLLRSQK